MIIRNVLAVLLASLTGLQAADSLIREQLPLNQTNVLVLEHPAQFEVKTVQEPEDQMRPAIRISVAGQDGSYRVVFKIFAGALQEAGPQSQADLDKAVLKMGAPYVPNSVEGTNEVHDLKLSQPGSLGAYSVFTDASLVAVAQPPAGEYRVMTLGLVRIGNFIFKIQGGSGDQHGVDYQAALKILSGLKVEAKSPGDGKSGQ